MRLVTRSDFDGLACGALLKDAGIIDSWKFAHPKDLQDGLVEITENDCLANVPFVEGCGLWFDHHSSEHERNQLEGKYKGESRITPSCARIIYDYYGGKARFSHYDEMMEAVDKVDSGHLTKEAYEYPPHGLDTHRLPYGPENRSRKMEKLHNFQLSAYGKAHRLLPHNDHRGNTRSSRCKGKN